MTISQKKRHTNQNLYLYFLEVSHGRKTPVDLRVDGIMYELQGMFMQLIFLNIWFYEDVLLFVFCFILFLSKCAAI